MGRNVDSLLHEIQRAASCNFISDLHTPGYLFDSRAKKRIAQIPDERYTLLEWNSALSYIKGTQCNYHSIREVKEQFKHLEYGKGAVTK